MSGPTDLQRHHNDWPFEVADHHAWLALYRNALARAQSQEVEEYWRALESPPERLPIHYARKLG